jgi:hypothetical protein
MANESRRPDLLAAQTLQSRKHLIARIEENLAHNHRTFAADDGLDQLTRREK